MGKHSGSPDPREAQLQKIEAVLERDGFNEPTNGTLPGAGVMTDHVLSEQEAADVVQRTGWDDSL